jgi:poly(A) polymerase
MPVMARTFSYDGEIPPPAEPAVEIVRALRRARHEALLAGGCVRDLLLRRTPKDYDVVTDAVPDRVRRLFRRTRLVGVQFGVVLVESRGAWVEVATFRTEGAYVDGRRPESVTFTDAEHDARRRDFTINGMLLDPIERVVHDYVGGHDDLEARRVRAIGEPAERFAEDHLRLLRAVRIATVLDFEIEPRTLEAVRTNAASLRRVAAERVREELQKILGDANRTRGLRLMRETGLLDHLWSAAADGTPAPPPEWSPEQFERAAGWMERLPADASFETAFAVLVAHRRADEIELICRALTFSNEQREDVLWLVANQAALDEPERVSLAALKRLMAGRAFASLRALVAARFAPAASGAARMAALDGRIAAVRPGSISPPPLITGVDLLSRGVPQGPVYAEILDALYTRQLDEELNSREQALRALESELSTRQVPPTER